MRIQKYGIVLRSLEASDLEMLRNWRNSDNVRPFMQYREFITGPMQQAWFAGLKPEENVYLIIEFNEEPIGLVNLKNINRRASKAEAGIFIGETSFGGSLIPVVATYLLMLVAFRGLKLSTLEAKIDRNNPRAIRFNEALGYLPTARETGEGFVYYEVQRDDFFNKTAALEKSLSKLPTDRTLLDVSAQERADLKLAEDFVL